MLKQNLVSDLKCDCSVGSVGPYCLGLDFCACVYFCWCGHDARVSEEEVRGSAHPNLHECAVSHPLHFHQDISKTPCLINEYICVIIKYLLYI